MRDLIEQARILLHSLVSANTSSCVVDSDWFDVESGDRCIRKVVTPEQERPALLDTEFEESQILLSQTAKILLVVNEIVSVDGLIGVVFDCDVSE